MKFKPNFLVVISVLVLVVGGIFFNIWGKKNVNIVSSELNDYDHYYVYSAHPSDIEKMLYWGDIISYYEKDAQSIFKVLSKGEIALYGNRIVYIAEVKEVFKGDGINVGDRVKLATYQNVDHADEVIYLSYVNLMQEDEEYLVLTGPIIYSPFEENGIVCETLMQIPASFFIYGEDDDQVLRGKPIELPGAAPVELIPLNEVRNTTFLSIDEDLLRAYHEQRQKIIAHFDPNYDIP